MGHYTTEQIDTMLAKYSLAGDQENFMTEWLDETHGGGHMRWGQYLMFWAQAKEQYLTTLFGGKLIQKFPFTADKSPADLRRDFDYDEDFNQCLGRVMGTFQGLVELYVREKYHLTPEDAFRFFRNIRHYSWRDDSITLVERHAVLTDDERESLKQFIAGVDALNDVLRCNETYVRNACDCSCRFTLPGCRKPFQMCDGQKPLKVLNNLFKYIQALLPGQDAFFNPAFQAIEDLRLRQSQLLNTKNFHGKLCLSIHPMDYMTMSDNGCGWHSCMRWEDGCGEYHAGTLEMMTSPSVVVAYLESDKNWFPLGECDGRTWSNKKWRELFIVTPDFMSGVKGYPYESDALENAVLAHLVEMAAAVGNDFDLEVQRFDRGGRVDAPNGTSFYFGTEIMYNDTDYTVLPVVFKKGFDKVYEGSRFYYGNGVYCIGCGRLRTTEIEDDNQDRLWCEECDDVSRCSYCGDRHDVDDMVRLDDGRMICSYCYDEHFVTCEVSGESGMDDEMELASLRFDYKHSSGYRERDTIVVKQELLDQLPEDCVEREQWWSETRYTLVRPLPEDNDLCKRFMEVINQKFDDGDSLWYSAVEEEKVNESGEEGAPSNSFRREYSSVACDTYPF